MDQNIIIKASDIKVGNVINHCGRWTVKDFSVSGTMLNIWCIGMWDTHNENQSVTHHFKANAKISIES